MLQDQDFMDLEYRYSYCPKPTPAIVQILGFKTSCMLQDQENQETKDHAKPEVSRSHALKPRFHGLGVYSY